MNAKMNRRHLGTASTLLVALAIGACQSDRDLKEATEEANLAKAVYCMDLLENQLDMETADSACFAERYTQHSPHVPDGRDAVVEFFTQRIERFPESTIDIKRAVAKDDLVWIHLHSKRTRDSLGSAVIHIFRMEDGKFAEHWGVGQAVPEEAMHDNTMF
ncbi:MAG: nuclear transport factor 2 family protein [Pseudomonadota bacterium]